MSIPRVIHQVWVGEKEKPTRWMNTWKDKHPDWEYILWDNKKVAEYPFKLRKEINQLMKEKKYHGVADLVRYEAVYDIGGVAMAGDSECVNPIDELLEEAFTAYENEVHYPNRLCPIIGAEKGHPFFKEVIDGLKGKIIVEPWIDCGNQYLTEVYAKSKHKIRIFPSYYFMPNHRLGGNYNKKEKVYAYQYSGTTFKDIGKENPVISIVIPVWGSYERYIPQCLQSIQDQSFREFEVIIIDTPNLPKARNQGIEKAKGKYILPLDVDDKLHPTYLEKVVSELNNNQDVVTTEHKEFEEHQSESQWDENITLENILKGDKPIACSAFKKEVWEAVGGYDENFSQGFEDWDYWIRVSKHGFKIKRIKEILYFYRKHAGSMSEGIHQNEELFNKLKAKHQEL